MTQRTAAAQRTKYVLDEADLPTQWYNIQADLKTPVPPVRITQETVGKMY